MSDTTQNPDVSGLVDRYLDIWNDTDPAGRRRRIETVLSGDSRYVDPLATASGHDEFDELVSGAQQQFAGLTFRPGPVHDAHHDLVRFTWELVADVESTADPIAVGFDVLEIDESGRVTRISGFLDSVPA